MTEPSDHVEMTFRSMECFMDDGRIDAEELADDRNREAVNRPGLGHHLGSAVYGAIGVDYSLEWSSSHLFPDFQASYHSCAEDACEESRAWCTE